MKNIFTHLESIIKNNIETLDIAKLNLTGIKLEIAPEGQGEFSTNAAMVLAKQAKMSPRQLAEIISTPLQRIEIIEKIAVAGAGFINITLTQQFWQAHLATINELSENFGAGEPRPQKINVEYVSANPTGPLHIGHCRGAVVGDALANILEFAGYPTTREYYTNDAGGQVDILAKSLHWRYCEALGAKQGEMPENLYPAEYLIAPAKQMVKMHGDKHQKSPDLDIFKTHAIAAMMQLIKSDLALLNIRHDVFFSEKSLHENGEIEKTINWLEQKSLVYTGTLPPPKSGKAVEDYEPSEQLLFKSTQFGDDSDRPLKKSNGEYTYFASDTAYFKNKYDRNFKEMVFILGADHAGYVKRMKALAQAIADNDAKLTIRLCQLVKLFKDGAPVKMGKRTGNFITLREVVDAVGKDAVRFMMLYRKNDAPLDFDFDKVREQSRENPVFYVQYAHARCHSVFRQATNGEAASGGGDTASGKTTPPDYSLLVDAGELALIRKIAYFPQIIAQVARHHEPHRLPFYLYELATLLHAQWNRGQNDISLRFVNLNESNLTCARLSLLRAVAATLKSGLTLIGVDAPKEMK